MGHTNNHYCLIPTLTQGAGISKRWLISGSEDHRICLWKINRSKRSEKTEAGETCVQCIPGRKTPENEGNGHCDVVLCVDTHPLMSTFASGGKEKDRSIKIWADFSE